MMLNHLTLLKFKTPAEDAAIDGLEIDLDELPNSIVEIQMYEFGRNVIRTPHCYDFAVLALFANEEALSRYLKHPAYLRVMQKIERMCASFITVGFFGSDAGSLREKPPSHMLLEDDF